MLKLNAKNSSDSDFLPPSLWSYSIVCQVLLYFGIQLRDISEWAGVIK